MDTVEDIRGRRQRENVQFLQELTPHLRAARSVERELDRQLARRFKVFRYLRDDELGLSRIIADLLDPAADHGQGTSFLEAMLDLLPEVPVDQLGSTAAATVRVEREITERRRIDITVDIPAENGPFCLAFENKPYADDLAIVCHYGGDRRFASYLRVYRKGWVRSKDVSDAKSDGRTTVMLECGNGGPTWWWWGVRSAKSTDAMTEAEKKRREEVEGALKERSLSLPKSSNQWPQWEDTRHPNWTAIVPELVEEIATGGGKITDYYVNGLLDIAIKAIPAIDEVELNNSTSSTSRDS